MKAYWSCWITNNNNQIKTSMVMKYCLTVLLAAALFNVQAQLKELPELKKEGLIADYRLAMEILKKQHPNPFKFIDSTSFNRKVDSLLKLAGEQDNVFAAMQ